MKGDKEPGASITMEDWETIEAAAKEAQLSVAANANAATDGSDATYEKMYGTKVDRYVQQLRVIWESAEAKEKEREWVKFQISGDLDDSRLVDGATGSKHIYRQRGFPEKRSGLFQENPKRVVFSVDASNSMSRGNGFDGRLDRLCETVAIVMESMEGFEHKFDYAILGHSAMTAELPLVKFGQPPLTQVERMEVLDKIRSHSQGCPSGDSTLEGTRRAIEIVREEENADDYLAFVMSDANLGRYGVKPHDFGDVLTSDPSVHATAIFLAEAGAAEFLIDKMPLGHAYACLEPERLPGVVREALSRASQEA